MDGNVVAFFVPTVIFILFVMPVWVYMHYRTKQQAQSALSGHEREELDWLARRRRLVRRAIMLSSTAAVIISVVIAMLFVSTYVSAKIGTAIAILWVATIMFLIAALFLFLRETSIAALGSESFKTDK